MNKLGGLWETQTKKGDKMMTGTVVIDGKETRLVCFTNGYKKGGDSKPDWIVYESEPMEKTQDETPLNDKPQAPSYDDNVTDEDGFDIPF